MSKKTHYVLDSIDVPIRKGFITKRKLKQEYEALRLLNALLQAHIEMLRYEIERLKKEIENYETRNN